MAFIGRVIVILFAVWLAIIAAGLVWSFGLLHAQWQEISADPVGRFVFWGATFLASGLTATVLFMPTLIAVVLAEAFSLRSILVYAFGGAAMMLIVYYGAGFGRSYEESIDQPPPPISRDGEIAAAAGAVFGLTYWLIAGRNAGRWRERQT
jgi:hypothetical protein